jgi:hypothetical protein
MSCIQSRRTTELYPDQCGAFNLTNDNISLQMNNLINLSNCKLFLSDNDDSVVLPSQLRPALPIDFVPPTLGSRCALFSVLHQHSICDIFHQFHFSLCAVRLCSTSFHPPYLAYSIKGAEDTSHLKTQLPLAHT